MKCSMFSKMSSSIILGATFSSVIFLWIKVMALNIGRGANTKLSKFGITLFIILLDSKPKSFVNKEPGTKMKQITGSTCLI